MPANVLEEARGGWGGGVEAHAWQLQTVQYLDETQPASLPLSKAVLLSFVISRWHLKSSDRKNN